MMVRLIKALSFYIYTYIACWCMEQYELVKCYYRVNRALSDKLKRERR